MNLHIVPDSSFINAFYDNLQEIGALENNRIVVRTNAKRLEVIRYELPFAKLNSASFTEIVGDTSQYEHVFIHYFTPLLYRWVAKNQFKALHWMVWGGDLYNLSGLEKLCYGPATWRYVNRDWSLTKMLYELKVRLTQAPYRRQAFSKIKNVLTWMEEEYRFATEHLPLSAEFRFFFYENNQAYHKIDELVTAKSKRHETPVYLLGNSGSPANNHLEVVRYLDEKKVKAHLLIPVSYGDARYIKFLKKNLHYRQGTLEFVEHYMKFEEYLSLLSTTDGLIMNTVRPQGYGNILMMMYMNKPVFFHEKNISLPDLTRLDMEWHALTELASGLAIGDSGSNKARIASVFAHERILALYKELFGN
jgi:dTDP-N-acetylfucosamine:lipid II N-acetylfucosaminyltransferase